MGTTDPLIGRLIDGRYRVSSRIARGGMATVYKATDLRLERTVAVKVMHGHLADDHQFKQRFIQEARSAARLAHPNVVNVYDQGQDEESAYLVMEYLPGITLRDLLHEYGALTPAQTVDIADAVLSGLAAAHKAGIVHRDLKPENVLLADDGRIKIGDFGLARAVSANTATGAALLGTIAYLSPELVTRGVADARSDIYAVGIMMYEMLTGEQPYKGEQPMQIAYQHANDQVPAPSLRNPRIPASLDGLVLWATSRDPEQRPADARAMLDELRETTRDIGPATSPQKTMVLPSAPSPRRTGPQPRAVSPDAETTVIGGAAAATTVLPGAPARANASASTAELPPSAGALRQKARKRRKRAWIVPLVILLALALAAGAGWWFAYGPGARIAVPTVTGLDQPAAQQKLRAQGFRLAATTKQENSTEIQQNLVIGTDPDSGELVAKGSTLTLIVSAGPKLIALPEFAGNTESAAKLLVKQNWTVAPSQHQYSATVPKDTVIAALGSDGTTLKTGQTYPQKAKITLVVSSGAVPDVIGKPQADATKALTDAGLQVGATPAQAYSDSVPEGSVISISPDPTKETLHPNDTVNLTVSQGPQPVPVPNIVGMTWTNAKAAIAAAGLQYQFKSGTDQAIATLAPNAATVKSVDPGVGQTVKKGATLTITIQFN